MHVSRIKESDTKSSVLKTAMRGNDIRVLNVISGIALVTIFPFSNDNVFKTYFQTTVQQALQAH